MKTLNEISEMLRNTFYGNFTTSIDNNGKVVVSGKLRIKENVNTIPVAIDILYGNFDARNSHLVTLLGCPQHVYGTFDISNSLAVTSLAGAPKIVTEDFICDGCPITSIAHIPLVIGGRVVLDNTNITSIRELSNRCDFSNVSIINTPLVEHNPNGDYVHKLIDEHKITLVDNNTLYS